MTVAEQVNATLDDIEGEIGQIGDRDAGKPIEDAIRDARARLYGVKRELRSIADARERNRAVARARSIAAKLDHVRADLTAGPTTRGNRPRTAIEGTVHAPPTSIDLHGRLGPTQQYDDQT